MRDSRLISIFNSIEVCMLRNFNSSEDNAVLLIGLLQAPPINLSDTIFTQTLHDLPNHTSPLNLIDELPKWQVENIAIQSEIEQFAEFPTPPIVHIKKNDRKSSREKIITLFITIPNDLVLELYHYFSSLFFFGFFDATYRIDIKPLTGVVL